jgi:sugar lactone lactonase YvrE
MDVVVEGFIVANGVVWKGDTLFVTETILTHPPKVEEGQNKPPFLSAVYAFDIDELSGSRVKLPPYDETSPDRHLVAVFRSSGRVGFGADGVAVDKEGNLYTSIIEDGWIYRTRFNDKGEPVGTSLFARSERMHSADGIVWREKDNRIYVADILRNAVHAVDMEGNVQTLHENPDTDGADGSLDQPCEVLLRGDELIVVSMDMPWDDSTGLLKNSRIDEPYTISVIPLQ